MLTFLFKVRSSDNVVYVFLFSIDHSTFLSFLFVDWVPPEIVAKCKVTLEFCCAEKESGNSSTNVGRMPYVWCGQLRRTINLKEEDKSHCARIAFFQCGVFVVSACAKVSSLDSSGTEESWWAPHAKIVRVGEETP